MNKNIPFPVPERQITKVVTIEDFCKALMNMVAPVLYDKGGGSLEIELDASGKGNIVMKSKDCNMFYGTGFKHSPIETPSANDPVLGPV